MLQLLTDIARLLQPIQPIIQAVQSIVEMSLLIFAFIFARELRESINARYLDGMKFVRDLIATEQAANNRKWVYQELEKAVRPLSPENTEKLHAICRDFDNIGLLCRHKLLPANIVAETYNRNILDMWKRLKPFILGWRQMLGDEDYYAEFEWLASKASKAEKRLANKRRIKRLFSNPLKNSLR
ncbi:MAG: DUF4760 domain-containing protein [Chloroflexi bacterium]|nr:DUF4760 domain-containing protein [Chloroflexota bacterium]